MLPNVFLWLALILVSFEVSAAPGDALIQDAQNAYQAKNEKQLSNDASQLHALNHVLANYADYWLMLLRLNNSDRIVVDEFLKQNHDYPFADKLKLEWLKILAKRQDWPAFYEELANNKYDDLSISCYAIEGRVAGGDSIPLTEGKTLWMSSLDTPSNCEKIFDLMHEAKLLTQDDIWKRFRLAMQSGKLSIAKEAIKREPNLSSSEIKKIERVFQNYKQGLDKKTDLANSYLNQSLYMYALERMALSQLDEAVRLWQESLSDFDAQEQNEMWARLAYQAARKHDPSALGLYAKVKAGELSRDEIAWKVRAALFAKNWPMVLASISEMPLPQQEEEAWKYWRGRAYKELGDTPKANALWVPLSHERSYYGLLADEEIGNQFKDPPSNYQPSDAEIANVTSNPSIERSVALERLGFRWESRVEWWWALRNMDDKQMLAAADFAIRQGWYDLGINTAEKTKMTHNLALRYPLPYRETFANFAKENGLDESWVYGLTRQESRFMTYAKSGVGASGLMQVMPTTASWAAKKLGITRYKRHMEEQMDTNIRLGTFYLRYTLDLMSGQALLATAAYNAGPGRARQWAPKESIEGAIYAETIPINETRLYVQKVLSNACFYDTIIGGKSLSIKQRLGVVAGAGHAKLTQSNLEK
jgi:soluble lytic murein transglycosylase